MNHGDIIIDGGDIFGNGVNGAARVEALADPAGIAVTSAVRDQVDNKRSLVSANRFAVVLGFCAVVMAFGVFWFTAHEEQTTDGPGIAGTSGAATLPAAPLQPTIAVLPFDNRGTAADQSYFSDGVTEDVIAALGRFSGLLILSWNAVVSMEGQLAPATQRALALGADYFVSGSV